MNRKAIGNGNPFAEKKDIIRKEFRTEAKLLFGQLQKKGKQKVWLSKKQPRPNTYGIGLKKAAGQSNYQSTRFF